MNQDHHQKIISVISEISERKKRNKQHPVIALSMEVWNAVKKDGLTFQEYKQAINKLARSGEIKHGRTINDVYFLIKNKEK